MAIVIKENDKECGLRVLGAIKGRTVKSFAFSVVKSHGDCIDDDTSIFIDFADGMQLRIEYDHLYSIEVCPKK